MPKSVNNQVNTILSPPLESCTNVTAEYRTSRAYAIFQFWFPKLHWLSNLSSSPVWSFLDLKRKIFQVVSHKSTSEIPNLYTS